MLNIEYKENLDEEFYKIIDDEFNKFAEKKGFENINLTTYGFQAPEFYKKCGYNIEFVRKNEENQKLDKYYLVKYFGGENE